MPPDLASRARLRTLLRLAPLVLALLLPSTGLRADEDGAGPKPGGPAKPGDPAPEGAPEGETPGDDGDLFDSPTTFTQDQVNGVIRRGIQWLKNRAGKDGGWGDLRSSSGARSYSGEAMNATGLFPGGLTSLALYTLLKCQVSLKDPVIKRGFASLKAAKVDVPTTSYATSMMLLAVCATADTAKSTKTSEKVKPKLTGEYLGWARKLADELLDMRKRFKTPVWRYNHRGSEKSEPPGGPVDLSATQLAALALFAANRVGVKVPNDVWEDILAFSLKMQDEEGVEVEEKDPVTGAVTKRKARGFSYIKGHAEPSEGKPTGGMTACGLANVMMARFVLTEGGRKKDQWEARPDAKTVQDSVYDGLAWLQQNWSGYVNANERKGGDYRHYWHYALERAMDLIGNQKIGSHFWYSEIGQELIDRQDSKGSWKGSQIPYEPGDVLDTCFSLLFLRRATRGTIPFPSVTGGTDEPVDNR